MNLRLVSLSVLIPDDQTNPLSFKKKTDDICQKTRSHFPSMSH